MLVEEVFCIVALAVFIGYFLGFLSLAVKSRLIYLDAAHNKLAVRRKLVACLKIHDIPDYNFIDMDFRQFAVPEHLGGFPGFLVRFQDGGFVFLTVFTDGRYAVGNQNRDQNPDRFKPFRLIQQKQDDLNQQSHKQNHDHRVPESLQEFFPQRFRRNLGQHIGAEFFPAFFNSLRG